MTTQPELVERLFEAALALEPGERGAFLEGACSHDPELRRTVEELLADDANAGSFLEHPLFEFLEQGEMRPPPLKPVQSTCMKLLQRGLVAAGPQSNPD